jgi:hypothetical protein
MTEKEHEIENEGRLTELSLRDPSRSRTVHYLATEMGTHARGTMLWFNTEKDLGALLTEDGERIEFPGSAFAAGEQPTGRCAGAPIEFDVTGDAVGRIVFVAEVDRRRARRRSR